MNRKFLSRLSLILLGMVTGAASLLALGVSSEWVKEGIRIGPTAEGLAILTGLGGIGGAIVGAIASVALGLAKLPVNWKSYLLCVLAIAFVVGGNVAIFFEITLAVLGK